MWQHGEHGATRCTLYPPDGDATQPDPDIMGVAGETPTAVTRGLVGELKAQGEEKGQHTFDKGLAIAQELEVGRFAPEIDGDGAVITSLAGRVAHESSSRQMVQWC